MKKKEDLKIEVGQVVDVSLDSMMGSTGYGWELTELTGSINLVGISVIPSSTRAIAPVSQVFHLRATAEGEATVTFVLTASWKVEEPVDEITYNIFISEASKIKEDDLKLKGYIAPPKATVRDQQNIMPPYNVSPPLPDYGIPCSDLWNRTYCCTPDFDECSNSAQILKYGVLPRTLYGINIPTTLYNVKMPPTTMYNIPPYMRYNFPDKCK